MDAAAGGEDIPERARDPVLQDLLSWAWLLTYWIVYPIWTTLRYVLSYAAFAVLFVVKLFYEPLRFIFSPILYLAQFILTCVAAPLRFLAKFETLYIYLGIAALVGIGGGLAVSYIYGSLYNLLRLDKASEQPLGRTAKQYRREKQKQKAKAEAPLMTSGNLSAGHASVSDGMRKGKSAKGLLSQTIMEEMDSDY